MPQPDQDSRRGNHRPLFLRKTQAKLTETVVNQIQQLVRKDCTCDQEGGPPGIQSSDVSRKELFMLTEIKMKYN